MEKVARITSISSDEIENISRRGNTEDVVLVREERLEITALLVVKRTVVLIPQPEIDR